MSEALFPIPHNHVGGPMNVGHDDCSPKWTERRMLDLIHARYAQVNPGDGPRYVVAEHVRNQCGFGGWWGTGPLRTADALVVDLWPSSGHLVHGFEVKVSRSDWLTELKDPDKAEAFKPYCDQWWLAVPDATIVRDDLPSGWGLMAVGKDGRLRVRKQAPKQERQPMPFEMTAAWLRATAKTAVRAEQRLRTPPREDDVQRLINESYNR